jgi:hypothetical protein
MTVEAARDALKRVAGLVAETSEKDVGWRKWRDDYVEPLNNELLKTEPFAPLVGAWIFAADGGGMVADQTAGFWAIERLKSGCSPDEIIRSAKAEIDRNVSHLLEVWAVFGADIDKAVQIADGVRILPAAQVEEEWRKRNVQRPLNPGPFDHPECCVLVQDVTITPAFSARTEAERGAETEPNDAERSRTAELVRAALLLNGSTAVEVNTRSRLDTDNQLLMALAGSRLASAWRGSPMGIVQFKADEFLTTYGELSGFRESESLLRAIDRLGRSRLNVFPADKALDLGIAAEILLMHGTGSSNTEIKNKLALRSAWLLGKDVEQRMAISQRAKALYDARSKVAHSGMLPHPERFDRATGDDFVASVSRAILRAGQFPDWEVLCVGG